jgi:hypothetical protein
MKDHWINCKVCGELYSETQERSSGTCDLCCTLRCDECLNEAGYCTPCSEKMDYSKDEAIAV